MTIIHNDHALDKLDVKRIKHANRIAFDLDCGKGVSQIRVIKSAENSPDGYEQEYAIDVDSELTLSEGYNDTSHDYPIAKAFDLVYNDPYCLRVKTATSAIREGDTLRVVWYSQKPGSQSSGYTGNAICALDGYNGLPLYPESLTLVIVRNGKHVAEFLLTWHMCPANSAQMVKWDGRAW